MPLDPSAQAFLAHPLIAGLKNPESIPLAEARAQYRRLMSAAPPGERVASVVDRLIPGPEGEIPIRVFTPLGAGPFALYVFFHGGGWVLGDLDTQASECRSLASQAGVIVVSVDYRHAPEHPFPAAPNDAYAALTWVAHHAAEMGGDATRIGVGGTSSGANLAAVCALMARDREGPTLRLQVLNVPVTSHDFSTDSYRDYARGYAFDRSSLEWCWSLYLPTPGDGQNPYASPLRAASLAGLPPAFVMTSECDALRAEGKAYADRLAAAGVPTTYRENMGMVHLFQGRGAREAVVGALRRHLA
jgi:acetyl esterase